MVAVAAPVAALGTTGADPIATLPGWREIVTVPSGGNCTGHGKESQYYGLISNDALHRRAVTQG